MNEIWELPEAQFNLQFGYCTAQLKSSDFRRIPARSPRISHPQKQAWLLPSGESEWIILPPNGLARQARLPPSLSSRGKKPKRAFAPLGAVADNACRKDGGRESARTDDGGGMIPSLDATILGFPHLHMSRYAKARKGIEGRPRRPSPR